jgi:phage/plasmid-associated DNA primase
LTGEASNQKALYFMIDKLNGKGDNGKSFFFELLSALMPNYVYNTSGTFLELKNNKSHKQLAMMKSKRLVWIDEQTKNKLKTELVKQVSNGKKIENEVMFGTSENINILFKLFIISNHVPNIDPSEDAVYNRYKQISFSSHFDRTGERKEEDPEKLEFIADITLGEKIEKEYYNEIFQLIIDYGHQFYKIGIVEEPLEFKEDKQETKEKNNPFIEWFNDNIIKDENEKLYIEDIVEKYGKTREIIRQEMERKGYKYDKDLSFGVDKISKKKKRGGFKGIRFLNENELGEEEDIKTISLF